MASDDLAASLPMFIAQEIHDMVSVAGCFVVKRLTSSKVTGYRATGYLLPQK